MRHNLPKDFFQIDDKKSMETIMLSNFGVPGLVVAIVAQIAAIIALAVYAPTVISVPLIAVLILF